MIKQISAQATYLVRQPILRPEGTVEDCIFQGDDDKLTAHFGAYKNDELVGIISIYDVHAKNKPMDKKRGFQIRGMATLDAVRGEGLGALLLERAEQFAMDNGADYIWANARTGALGFYEKASYKLHSEEFMVEGVGLHYVIIKVI